MQVGRSIWFSRLVRTSCGCQWCADNICFKVSTFLSFILVTADEVCTRSCLGWAMPSLSLAHKVKRGPPHGVLYMTQSWPFLILRLIWLNEPLSLPTRPHLLAKSSSSLEPLGWAGPCLCLKEAMVRKGWTVTAGYPNQS